MRGTAAFTKSRTDDHGSHHDDPRDALAETAPFVIAALRARGDERCAPPLARSEPPPALLQFVQSGSGTFAPTP